MSNPNRIRIIYHPARKDIKFIVYENENEVNEKFETLEKYSIYGKDRFVLSLVGSEFFEDIIHVFPTKSKVDCSIRTTRLDYEDFKQKVEDFNENYAKPNDKCLINLLELDETDELVDMKIAFEEIKKQGENIYRLLDKYSLGITNIKCRTENSKSYLTKIAERIKYESKKIKESLKSLVDDNNVNICLIGVHSSGKSTLINTLLGYKLLPVDIRPETAKMLKIQSVKDEFSSFIEFSKKDKICHINWNVKNAGFYISNSNIDDNLKAEVEEILYKNGSLKLHEQIYGVLDFLNAREDLNACIDFGFPIPFNTEDLKFTIYDTPGADSNVGYHKKILSEALSNQTNSILIYVLLPDSLSGSGNVELMQELLEKSTDLNNAIDVEQSFFVFNKADSSSDELDKLANSQLKKTEDDKSPINLAERKLFFISSRLGFSAKVVKNETATEVDKKYVKFHGPGSLDSDLGRFYQHNHIGKSEYATNQMLKNANETLDKTENEYDKYLITSGIYTLESEIKNYGERYASAVKTSAIIKSIEGAADSVTKMVNETKLGDDEELKKVKDELEDEIQKVEEIIDCTSKVLKERQIETKRLGVDSESFQSRILEPVENILDKRLEKFLRLFRVHVDEQMESAIQTEIKEIYQKYSNSYKDNRQSYLKATQSSFIEDFFRTLNEDSSISEDIKNQLKNIKAPVIPEFGLDGFIDELFKNAKLFDHKLIKGMMSAIANFSSSVSSKLKESVKNDSKLPKLQETVEAKGFKNKRNIGKQFISTTRVGEEKVKVDISFIAEKINDGIQVANDKIQQWITKTISKKAFVDSVIDWCQTNQGKLTSKFEDDYKEALVQMCDELSNEFKNNIDRYSTKIRALKEDNKPLELLAEEIKNLEKQFNEAKVELDKKI